MARCFCVAVFAFNISTAPMLVPTSVVPRLALSLGHQVFGATNKRGLRYNDTADCVIPGFGSGTRAVTISDVVRGTVFLQVPLEQLTTRTLAFSWL